jgi:hypothetical protein
LINGSRREKDAQEQRELEEVTPTQVTNMTDEDFDAYLARLSTSVNHESRSAKLRLGCWQPNH